jgi:BirA family biotin operon repressor/biotin-[acetyl-CoA-carboxylase] ligase
LTAAAHKIQWIERDTLDSTNDYAMSLVRGGEAKDGMVIFSLHQTAGKGQRGKAWKDVAGQSLSCTLLIEPERYGLKHPFHAVALSAAAIRKTVEATTGRPVHIKWPNDIYVGDRKAGGILIESVSRGKDWKYAVIGFGLNVNHERFDASLPNPVSLRQLTGKNYDIKALAQQCVHAILKDLQDLPFEEVLADYTRHLYKLNESVTLRTPQGMITDILKGVTSEGWLMTGTDILREFAVGNVEWISQEAPSVVPTSK